MDSTWISEYSLYSKNNVIFNFNITKYSKNIIYTPTIQKTKITQMFFYLKYLKLFELHLTTESLK